MNLCDEADRINKIKPEYRTAKDWELLAYSRMGGGDIEEYLWEKGEVENYRKRMEKM